MNRAWEYAEGVLAGEVLACEYVKQACQRFFKDLQNPKYEFREEKVDKVISFIQDLKHSADQFKGKNFILEPWESFIVTNLYGFYVKATGKRRYRSAYIEMARKQGKSALVDALGLYHLSYDDQPAAEVLLAANSKEQATEVYKIAKRFVKNLDPEGTLFRPFRHEIHFGDDESFFKVLASDALTLDSYNCNCGIVDEYHSAPDSSVRDVIKSSQGMWENPMLITITSPGFDKSLPCYELRTTCTEILAEKKTDESIFTIIYTLDEGDKWTDPNVWVKSNPNLGITLHEDWLQDQVTGAINNPSEEVGVRTKNLGEWMDTAQTWIPDRYILQATQKIDDKIYKDTELFIGIDLASNIDLTAVSFMAEKGGKQYYKTLYYIPHESLSTRPDKELYKQWVRNKHLIVTPGNVTDYEYITKDILDLNKRSYIVRVAYDAYNATQWAIGATQEGLPIEPYSQSIGNFNKPTKEFERQILSGGVVIDDNPISRYCLRNIILRMDHNGNVKPDKVNAKKKIDGAISMIQALAMYQEYSNTYIGKIF